LTIDLSDLKKPGVWIPAAGAVVAMLAFLGSITFDLKYRLPALEKSQSTTDAGLRNDMKAMSDDLHAHMKAMSDDVRDEMKSMDATLAGVKANMMLLCAGQRRPLAQTCDVRGLVADAKSVIGIQAQLVDGVEVNLRPGATAPQVSSQAVKEHLPAYTWSDTHAYPSGKPGKADFATMMLWSSAADSAHWRQEGNTVRADFANGATTFRLGEKSSREQKQALVDSLNATAEALQARAASEPSGKQ
jgi:hypothetical protein